MTHRLPALALLAVLLGGLGASSVHRAAHALEWAETQRAHALAHHAEAGDHAQEPCDEFDAHDLDCAVCSGLSGAVAESRAHAPAPAGAERQRAADAAWAEVRRAVTPARGPPAVA